MKVTRLCLGPFVIDVSDSKRKRTCSWTITTCFVFRRNPSCSASDSASSYTFFRSVVCLSCTLLKPFDRFKCYLAVHLCSLVTHFVGWGSLELQDNPLAKTCNCKLQPLSVLCCHMANTNEKFAIPPFANLLWSSSS